MGINTAKCCDATAITHKLELEGFRVAQRQPFASWKLAALRGFISKQAQPQQQMTSQCVWWGRMTWSEELSNSMLWSNFEGASLDSLACGRRAAWKGMVRLLLFGACDVLAGNQAPGLRQHGHLRSSA